MLIIVFDFGFCGIIYLVWLNGNEIKIIDVYGGIMIIIVIFIFILYLFYI